jgi:hypothetical protein
MAEGHAEFGAFSRVSCTRSSASARWRVNRTALRARKSHTGLGFADESFVGRRFVGVLTAVEWAEANTVGLGVSTDSSVGGIAGGRRVLIRLLRCKHRSNLLDRVGVSLAV